MSDFGLLKEPLIASESCFWTNTCDFVLCLCFDSMQAFVSSSITCMYWMCVCALLYLCVWKSVLTSPQCVWYSGAKSALSLTSLLYNKSSQLHPHYTAMFPAHESVPSCPVLHMLSLLCFPSLCRLSFLCFLAAIPLSSASQWSNRLTPRGNTLKNCFILNLFCFILFFNSLYSLKFVRRMSLVVYQTPIYKSFADSTGSSLIVTGFESLPYLISS